MAGNISLHTLHIAANPPLNLDYRRSVLHSNMDDGAMFSLGGQAHTELGWTIVLDRMGDNSQSGEPICAGDIVHILGMGTGKYFHSNSPEGGGFSGGGFHQGEHGWIIQKCNKRKGKIRIGDDVMLKGQDSGAYLHSNMGEGGGCSWGGSRPDLGWNLSALSDYDYDQHTSRERRKMPKKRARARSDRWGEPPAEDDWGEDDWDSDDSGSDDDW